MIFRLAKEKGKCEYGEWSRKKKRIVCCGKKAYVLAGDKYLCREHLPFGLAGEKNPNIKVTNYPNMCNGDFLRYVDKYIEEYNKESINA